MSKTEMLEKLNYLRKYRIAIILMGLILIAALTLRIDAAYHWNSIRPNDASRLVGDEPGYDNTARELLAGYGYNWPGRVPVYPVFLAGIYHISNGSYAAVPYLQSILGVLTVFITILLGWRIFGPLSGLVAGGLAAVSYILIHQSLHLLSEVLYTHVLLMIGLAMVETFYQPTERHFIQSGFWTGISNLIRPGLLFFPLFILFPIFLFIKGGEWKRYWLVFLISSTVVILPWFIRNTIHYKAIFPLQTSNAFLWQGSPEYYHLLHEEGYSYLQIWTEVIYGENWQAHDPTSIEGDRWWTRRAIHSILAEPHIYIWYGIEKLGTFWVGDPYADWNGSNVFNYSALREIGFTKINALQYFLARLLPVVALICMFFWRREWKRLLPLLIILIYFNLFHAATHAEARLSDPLQPFLLILVAGTFVKLLNLKEDLLNDI